MSVVELDYKKNPRVPKMAPGDTVKVFAKVVEGDKTRTQVFQGVVIKTREGGVDANFTVRRVAYGVGVDRTFPVNSPHVEKVEIVRKGKVRRARLFYLRGLSGKAARIKEKRVEFAELVPEVTEAETEAEIAKEIAEQQPQAAAEAPAAEAAKPAEAKAETPAPENKEQAPEKKA